MVVWNLGIHSNLEFSIPRSETIRRVYEIVYKIERKWEDYYNRHGKGHPDLKKMKKFVRVELDDGCCFNYEDAFVESYTDESGHEWYIVFPEHHDTVVFSFDDVLRIMQYRSLSIKNLNKRK